MSRHTISSPLTCTLAAVDTFPGDIVNELQLRRLQTCSEIHCPDRYLDNIIYILVWSLRPVNQLEVHGTKMDHDVIKVECFELLKQANGIQIFSLSSALVAFEKTFM